MPLGFIALVFILIVLIVFTRLLKGSYSSNLPSVANSDDDSGFLTAVGTDALINGAQELQDASSMIPSQLDLPAPPPEPAQPPDNPPILLENPDPPSAPDPGPQFDSSVESGSNS